MIAVGGPILVVALVVGAWAVDSAASSGQVARNVTLAGEPVGGRDRDELEATVHELAADFATTGVRIDAGDDTYESTADELGLRVDENATVDAVLDMGHDGVAPLRPLAWAVSFARDRAAPIRYEVDRDELRATVVELEGDARTAPAEPQLTAGPTGVRAVPGVPGEGVEIDALADGLVRAARHSGKPLEVTGVVGPVPPRFTDAEARQVAVEATRLMAAPLSVTIGAEVGIVPQATMWSWARADVGGDDLVLALDPAAVDASLKSLFPTATTAVDASFQVIDGAPILIGSQDGTVCCEADSPARILAALRQGAATVEVALSVTHPTLTTEQAQAYGIVEEVGQPDEFGPTTNHAAGEPRVTNIHRIADIIRGYVIKPGETFSVNDYVGERTVEKGFVDAPVIYNGNFEHDVGGGVSQFATTAFNAALFAGLEFGEYQSHSIVISRYPKGHEATISYPHPDLQIKNPTPYGVLLWPTYTDSSITVHLYSTHYVDVTLGDPTSKAQGNCTRWTTPRTRTYVDGHTDQDSVFAVYRPGEGINC